MSGHFGDGTLGFGELESERVGKVWAPHFPTLHSLILSSSHGTHAEVVEALDCNPSLIRCEAGVFLHFLVCSLTVKPRAHNPSDAGAIPAGPTISSRDPKPDQRAGTVSKTDCAMGIAWGASPLRVRQFPTKSVWQSKSCTRFVNELTSGQIRQPTPFPRPHSSISGTSDSESEG